MNILIGLNTLTLRSFIIYQLHLYWDRWGEDALCSLVLMYIGDWLGLFRKR